MLLSYFSLFAQLENLQEFTFNNESQWKLGFVSFVARKEANENHTC